MLESSIRKEPAAGHTPRTPGYAARLGLRDAPKPFLTWALVAIHTCLFVWMGLGGSLSGDRFLDFGANYGPATLNEPWRLLSCGFVHSGLVHLIFNSSALLDFGAVLERTVGRWRFLVVYLLSLLCASAASHAWAPMQVSVGASGAILGLAGYQFVVPPSVPGQEQPIEGYRRSMLMWLGLILLVGLWLPLDNAAHLGGFVTGTILALLFRPDASEGRTLAKRVLGSAALLFSIIGLVLLGHWRVRLDPQARARAHYLAGIQLLEQNQNRAALIELDQAVELVGARALFERRAIAKQRLGDPEGAWIDARSGFTQFDKQARGQPWIPYTHRTLLELREIRRQPPASEGSGP